MNILPLIMKFISKKTILDLVGLGLTITGLFLVLNSLVIPGVIISIIGFAIVLHVDRTLQ